MTKQSRSASCATSSIQKNYRRILSKILSALFSNKKLTLLAFNKKLKGLESAQLKALIRQLNEWKKYTAEDKEVKALLDNFTVIEYDDLKAGLESAI